jgi:heme exporter protein CcmD
MMLQSFAMGAYGAYVWPAYAASAILLIVTIVLTLRAYFHATAELRRIEDGGEPS